MALLGLRLLLIVDALALAAASTISDPIFRDVAAFPIILLGMLLAIACLSGDLVPPRRRVDVVCSALTLIVPIPSLLLPEGQRVAAVAIIVLQVVPLVRRARVPRQELPGSAGTRRVIAALVIATGILLVLAVALIWYGATYLVQPPKGVFRRGPYMTAVGMTSAALAWQLQPGDRRAVLIGALGPDGAEHVAVNGLLAGLRPGTRYAWTANVGGRSEAAGAFTTAAPTAAVPFTLVSFGDYGSGSDHEYAVGRLAAALDPRLVLSSGDNAYLLAAPPFLDRAIFQPMRTLLGEAPMVAALGEHDIAWRDGAAVVSALHLPGHHYAVQYGPVQVVVLGLQVDAYARSYAARTIGRCHPACPVRFVLVHRPVSSRDPIIPLLRRRGVAAILAGHLHRYERRELGGVLEFTVGTGGEGASSAGFTPASPGAKASMIAYGFLAIDVATTRIDYRFINDQGRILDSATEAVHP